MEQKNNKKRIEQNVISAISTQQEGSSKLREKHLKIKAMLRYVVLMLLGVFQRLQ